MRIVRWAAVNLGIFAAASLALVVAVGLIQEARGVERPGVVGRAIYAWGLLLGLLLPALAVYLLIVALLPARWSRGRRRLAAIAIGPVAYLLLVATGLLDRPEDLGALAAGLGLFLVPGLIVRLPDWRSGASAGG